MTRDSQPNATNIDLHIDKLVLHGFEHASRHHIGAAVQRELQRLLQAQGLPHSVRQPMKASRLQAQPISIKPNAKPSVVGRQIASTVYRGLKP